MYAKGLVLLYPNFNQQYSFSTNYYEEGIHSVPQGKDIFIPDRLRSLPDDRFQVPLFKETDLGNVLGTLPASVDEVHAFTFSGRIPIINLYNQVVQNFSKLEDIGDAWINSVKEVDLEGYALLIKNT